jgi:hypothetical protein
MSTGNTGPTQLVTFRRPKIEMAEVCPQSVVVERIGRIVDDNARGRVAQRVASFVGELTPYILHMMIVQELGR